ncbi:MAG TPA: hypothetical protein VL460_06585 [Caulobacteraceae bacterium]|nr:hypothetical protein [Caulobacteraceae bacterium]
MSPNQTPRAMNSVSHAAQRTLVHLGGGGGGGSAYPIEMRDMRRLF